MKICTVDTDVVVLAIASVPNQADGTEVWIAFGTGKDFCYIPTHIILKYLGPMKSLSLPMFHSFTGCNSFSLSKYWKIWELNDELTRKFYALHKVPDVITGEAVLSLERFTILLYLKPVNNQI